MRAGESEVGRTARHRDASTLRPASPLTPTQNKAMITALVVGGQ